MAKQPLSVAASSFIFKDLHLHGFWVSNWNKDHPGERERMLAELSEWMQGGHVQDVSMNVLKLSSQSSLDNWFENFKSGLKASQTGYSSKKVVMQHE